MTVSRISEDWLIVTTVSYNGLQLITTISNFSFSRLLAPESPADDQCQGSTSTRQQTEAPTNKPITTIDGNVHFAEPNKVKIVNNIKINIKNGGDIKATPKVVPKICNRKKVVLVRPKADETSGLCSIM